MFGLEDLMKKVDLGDILDKFNLGDKEKEEVKKQTVDAVNYRAKKEKSRGNEGIMENLFSSKPNTSEADTVKKKLEGDLAFNLKKKSNLDEGIIDKIKGEIMDRFLGGASNAAKEKGDEDGKGLMGLLSGDNILDNIMESDIAKKLKGLF